MPASSPRWSPHFNGRRRVRIVDLLDAGLLRPGQTLLYQQRQGETPHESVVTERGRLRLADGREFDSPSGAGTAVSKLSAVPGWTAWRVGADGPSLHELRAQLLERAAEEEAEPQGESHLAFLRSVRERAVAGDPVALTLQDLLAAWGADGRDRDVIHRIGVDLANAGLTTEPDFRAVSPDRVLRLILPREDDEPIVVPAGEAAAARQGEPDDEASDDIGLTLGYLVGEKAPLTWVSPSASLEKAVTEMEINDFSQLPVLADPTTLHGVVSWQSIARWRGRSRTGTPTLSDVVTKAQVFDYDVRLLDVLDALRNDEFIFVRDYDRKITGIITAADLVETYDKTATPFFLIGEVDQELRQLLRNTFGLDTIRRICGTSISSLDKLTMYHYETVLNDPACWAALNWGLDREVVNERLREIRQVRNRVMHFNADLVDPADVEKLRNFLAMIRRYAR